VTLKFMHSLFLAEVRGHTDWVGFFAGDSIGLCLFSCTRQLK